METVAAQNKEVREAQAAAKRCSPLLMTLSQQNAVYDVSAR